jgi:hypothetical protein
VPQTAPPDAVTAGMLAADSLAADADAVPTADGLDPALLLGVQPVTAQAPMTQPTTTEIRSLDLREMIFMDDVDFILQRRIRGESTRVAQCEAERDAREADRS